MGEAFPLSAPVWTIVGRTSLVYLAVVVLMRFAPKRRSGSISPNDIIALVLLGALAGDGIMGGANSVSDVMLMIGTVVAWGYLIDILEYRFPFFQRIIREDETSLIRDGRILWRNLRREWVTKDELMAALREEGIADPSDVKSACLEADGQISVVPSPAITRAAAAATDGAKPA
jgi:uncharacterized membrane protein YcaP (DUF421 family)